MNENNPLKSETVCMQDLRFRENASASLASLAQGVLRHLPRHGYCVRWVVEKQPFGQSFGRFEAMPTEDPNLEGKIDEVGMMKSFRSR